MFSARGKGYTPACTPCRGLVDECVCACESLIDIPAVAAGLVWCCTGVKPESPYLKMEQQWAMMQETAKVRARQAQQLDPEELRVLQRFYDQLCALVEAQRMSDPLSLMVIHKVSLAGD